MFELKIKKRARPMRSHDGSATMFETETSTMVMVRDHAGMAWIKSRPTDDGGCEVLVEGEGFEPVVVGRMDDEMVARAYIKSLAGPMGAAGISGRTVTRASVVAIAVMVGFIGFIEFTNRPVQAVPDPMMLRAPANVGTETTRGRGQDNPGAELPRIPGRVVYGGQAPEDVPRRPRY